jgi:hypothetical protein
MEKPNDSSEINGIEIHFDFGRNSSGSPPRRHDSALKTLRAEPMGPFEYERTGPPWSV